jgi:iron(III) transport system permease protein
MRFALVWIRRVRQGGQERAAMWLVFAVLTVAILYPVASLIRKSLQVSERDQTLTLRWYQDLASAAGIRAIATTALLIVTAGLLSVVLGLVLAWMVERVEVRVVFLARMVPIFPLLVPGVMGAAAWAFLLSPNAGYLNVALRSLTGSHAEEGPLNIFSLWGVIFVVTLYVVPFTYTVFYPAFRSMDGAMEEAAQIAGAGPFTVARTVTFGLVRPAVLGAILLAFVLSIEHFIIPFMLGFGKLTVLTTRIYRFMAITFPSNVGAAAATSMLALIPSLLFLTLQHRLLRRGSYAVIGGKGGGARKIRNPIVRWVSGLTLLGYALLAFVLPMAGILLVALQRFWNGHITLKSLSLSGFSTLQHDYPQWVSAVKTSALLALIGSTMSVLLAFVIAYLSIRVRSRAARALDIVGTVPAGIPATVFGVGFLMAFIRPPLALYGTIWLLVLAYLVIFIPFAIRPVAAAIRQVAPELEDASRMSGDTWWGAVGRITVPLVMTSLLAAWALLFLMLSREVAASVFLAAAGQKLIGPVIFELWANGQAQILAVFSLVVIAGSAVFVGLAQWMATRQTIRLGFSRPIADRARGRTVAAAPPPVPVPDLPDASADERVVR